MIASRTRDRWMVVVASIIGATALLGGGIGLAPAAAEEDRGVPELVELVAGEPAGPLVMAPFGSFSGFGYALAELPPGLDLDRTVLDFAFSGTPTTPGTYPAVIRVEWADTPGVQEPYLVTFEVAAAPTIVWSTTSLGRMAEGSPIDLPIIAEHATSYSLVGGALPAGLVLEAEGRLHGTPTAAGAYAFTVEASNATSSSLQEFRGVVEAPGGGAPGGGAGVGGATGGATGGAGAAQGGSGGSTAGAGAVGVQGGADRRLPDTGAEFAPLGSAAIALTMVGFALAWFGAAMRRRQS